jgi:tripartite-type tricarboxylate transporter receptor subunit TctC
VVQGRQPHVFRRLHGDASRLTGGRRSRAPKGTPVEIIQKLNVEINAGLADPDVRSRYAALGSVPNPGSPADFGKLIADETEKWAKVIKFAGIKPE